MSQFKFYDDEEDRAGLFGNENDLVPIHLLHAHRDPFYNECRAFGRIVEADLNGKIAVRCYGYLAVSAKNEEELKRRFNIETWDRPDKECFSPASNKQPFRAIVKDLILDPVPFTDKQVKKMLRDLKRLRRLGIYPRDVQARNYVGGLLVDMSIAITEPHFFFSIRPKWHVRKVKEADLLSFDTMMKEAKVVTWHRATRNKEYCMKLRSRKGKGKSPKR